MYINTPQKNTLLTIPPEILLTIISHLPSSASIYSLSLASRSLSTFVRSHAATISNTRIYQNALYSQAATILQSSYHEGWLVPQHPIILDAEDQWQHELGCRANSRSSSPCSEARRRPTSHIRVISHGSDSTAVPSSRSLNQPISCHSYAHGTWGWSTFSPAGRALTPKTMHTDPSLGLSLGLPSPFRISLPGPHYLVFLERYAAAIVAQWEMDIGNVRAASPTSTLTEHGTQLHPIEEADEEEMEKREARFQFMVKRNCLRGWMVLCHNTFVLGMWRGDVGYAEVQECAKFDIPSRRETLILRLENEWMKMRQFGKDKVSRVLKSLKRKQKQGTRRLLFGELDPDSASSLASEVGRARSTGSPGSPMNDWLPWEKGLLWFYGVASQFEAPSLSGMVLDTEKQEASQPKKKTSKDRGKWYYELKAEHHRLQEELEGSKVRKSVDGGLKVKLRRLRGRVGDERTKDCRLGEAV